MVWEHIPKEEARIMAQVWAIQDARVRNARKPPEEPVDPPSGSLLSIGPQPPQELLSELQKLTGSFDLSDVKYWDTAYGDAKTGWDVKPTPTVLTQVAGKISSYIEKPSTWFIDLKVHWIGPEGQKFREHRLSLRWSTELSGSVLKSRNGKMSIRIPLKRARSLCGRCRKKTVLDTGWDGSTCFPCIEASK